MNPRAVLEDVEERILYAADLAPAAFGFDPQAAERQEQLVESERSLAETRSSEIVFIDAGIEDAERLIADLEAQRAAGRPLDIVLIGAGEDGIALIGATLAERTDIAAVHIVSHGENGALRLGAATLDGAALFARAGEIAAWGGALGADADLLLYGCDLAADAGGRSFVDALAALTGADVAASEDPTGALALGGDWVLEYATGGIEAKVAPSLLAQARWDALLAVAAGPSETGTAIWGSSGNAIPQTSEWDGLTFSAAANAAGTGQWRMISAAEAPTRDELITVGVTAAGVVQAQMWNGASGTWSALPIAPLGTVSESNRMGFAVAYESASGDALLVWNDSSQPAGKLRYSVWDGSVWSAPAAIAAYGGAEPQHMQLAANPGSDEMVLVVNDASSRDYALVWNGAGWGNAITLDNGAGGEDDQTPIAVTYEAQSGRALAVYGKDGDYDVYYRVWNGAGWSAESAVGLPFGLLAQTQWISVASDPNSNRLALGSVTNNLLGATVSFAVWNGSSWGSYVSATSLASASASNMAVAFEARTGDMLAVYGAGDNSVRYRTWTPSGGWSAQVAGPDLGAKPTTMTLTTDAQTDQIMLLAETAGRKLYGTIWDGIQWGARTQLASDTGETASQPFAFVFDRGRALETAGNALWLSPASDASSPQWPGVNAISKGEVLRLGNPDLAFAPGTTSGTFEHVFNLKDFTSDGSADIDALHYVGRTVALPGYTLIAGDVLFSTADNETFAGNNTIAATKDEIVLFRPDTPGDYRSGTFMVLLDNFGALHGGGDTWSIALVEQPVMVGEAALAAGTFLFSRQGASEDDDIYRFVPTGVGPGATAGSVDVLIFGEHLGIGEKLAGLDIVTTATPLGNVVLPAGAILLSLDNDDASVGSNLLAVTKQDAFYLQVTRTSLGGQTALASATMLLRGADIGMAGEAIDTLALVIANNAPVLDASGAPVFAAIAEDAAAPAATTVAAMLATGALGAPISDVDPGAVQGIAVIGADRTNGTWQFSTNAGASWTSFGTLADSTATLLDASALIRFIPNADYNGAATLSFRAWDQFSGANGQTGVNASLNGGASAFSTAVESATITVGAVNDDPVLLINAGLTLAQGASAVIDASRLKAGDVDDAANALTFTVTALPVHGTLERGGIALGLNDTFTQQDVAAGLVTYTQDNTPNPADSFFFRVTDAAGASAGPDAEFLITVSNTNNAPVIVANSLVIAEGGSAVPNLAATDVESAPAQLLWSVTAVSGGHFALAAAPGSAITAFSQAQIDAGQIVFVHDGAEAAPSYSLAVSDGALSAGPQAGAINFSNVNDAPVVTANALNVIEGGSAAPLLAAADPDNTPAELQWSVSNLSGGRFEHAAAPGVAITTFTQAEVDAGDIRFVHDGGEAAPAYEVTLSDGSPGPGPAAASVTFTRVNDAPAIAANTLAISQRASVVLGAANLAAADPDNTPDELVWSVTAASGGRFELAANPGIAVFSFTQEQVNAGEVLFVHDGAEAAPAYTVFVSDGGAASAAQAGTIAYSNVNDAPVIVSDGGLASAALSIAENGSAVTSVLATDPDAGAVISYSIAGGADAARFTIDPASGALAFVAAPDFETPADADRDNVYEVIVAASDGALAATQAISVTVTGLNEAPLIEALALTVVEGGSVVVTAADLRAGDPENTPAQLVWTISALSGGRFEHAAAPGVAITTFTQADVNAGSVRFVDDGDETAPAFAAAVSDGSLGAGPLAAAVTYVAVDDAPTAVTGGGSAVAEGGQADLRALGLSALDPDTAAADLTFTIHAPFGAGALLLSGVALGAGDSFTQADIDAGRLAYRHDGSETSADAIVLSLGDGSSVTAPFAFQVAITPVNDAPTLATGEIAIAPGQAIVVSADWLRAADAETSAAGLTLGVSAVAGGRFERIADPGVAISSFTQAEIDALAVRFVHDGSAAIPTFALTLSDGTVTIGPLAVSARPAAAADAPPAASIAAAPESGQPAQPAPAAADAPAPPAASARAASMPAPAEVVPAVSVPEPRLPGAQAAEAETQAAARPSIAEAFAPGAGSPARATLPLGLRAEPPAELLPIALSVDAANAESGFLDTGLAEMLRNREAVRELDVVRDAIGLEAQRERSFVASSIAVSTGLSIGYVLWLIRGGVLLGSVLTSLPAWKALDPLPILGTAQREGKDDDPDDEVERLFRRKHPSGAPAQPQAPAADAERREQASKEATT